MRILKTLALYAAVFMLAFAAGFALDLWQSQRRASLLNLGAQWNDALGTVQADIAYGDKPAQKFDLYLPADKTRAAYGLVVYLHAGGFTTGDKADDAQILKWFAAQGYVASGINYTLQSVENPSASVKSMSDEIRAAMPQVVAKARALGYPIDKMAVGGGSAGHGLAAIYAYRDGADAPAPIAFVFGMVGPVSFEVDVQAEPSAESAGFLSVLAGERITAEMMADGSYKEAIKPIDAYRWVNENSPPTLFAFGKLDRVMPFSTRPLMQALQTHGVPHDVLIFEKSGHGMHRDKDKQALYLQKLNEYLAQYLPTNP